MSELQFLVLGDAPLGSVSGLTIASKGLGDEHGADLQWTSGIAAGDGMVGVTWTDPVVIHGFGPVAQGLGGHNLDWRTV